MKAKSVLEEFPIPNALNFCVVCLQLLALAACFTALSHNTSLYGLLFLAFCFGLVMNSVYSTIHEAHHRILFSNRMLNDAGGIFLALFFPAPFHLLRQGHLGHHRKNRSDDEAFDLYFDRDHRLWKYLAWYGILTGLYWIVVVLFNLILLFIPRVINPALYKWDKTSEVFIGHFRPETFKIMRWEALAAVVLQATIFWLVGAPWQQYCTMYFGFGLMWSSLQYVHHYQAERDVIDGARNLHVWAPIDLIWLNHNWHQTHHQIPTVPWCYLPELARKANTPTSFLLPAYLRMWRGPQYAEAGVHRRFEGEISR